MIFSFTANSRPQTLVLKTLWVALLCLGFTCPALAETGIFPPANAAAGSGLLYFPAGGESSLYAVPVISDEALLSTLQAQTVALQEQTTAIKELKNIMSKAQSVQCTSFYNGNFISICTNVTTGKICWATINSASWVCTQVSGYSP